MSDEDFAALAVEVAVMRRLPPHPHIVRLAEYVETPEECAVVMERMLGGELFDRLATCTKFGESDARRVVRSVVSALLHCHACGVAHRDLKPENLLFETAAADSVLKVADFGLARVVAAGELMGTACGSPEYVAPEVRGCGGGLCRRSVPAASRLGRGACRCSRTAATHRRRTSGRWASSHTFCCRGFHRSSTRTMQHYLSWYAARVRVVSLCVLFVCSGVGVCVCVRVRACVFVSLYVRVCDFVCGCMCAMCCLAAYVAGADQEGRVRFSVAALGRCARAGEGLCARCAHCRSGAAAVGGCAGATSVVGVGALLHAPCRRPQCVLTRAGAGHEHRSRLARLTEGVPGLHGAPPQGCRGARAYFPGRSCQAPRC